MEWFNSELVGAYALGLVLLFVFIKIFYVPLKAAVKLALSAVGGGVILYVFNLAGSLVGMQIGLNLFTALVAGLLGIPGMSLLLILQIVLKA